MSPVTSAADGPRGTHAPAAGAGPVGRARVHLGDATGSRGPADPGPSRAGSRGGAGKCGLAAAAARAHTGRLPLPARPPPPPPQHQGDVAPEDTGTRLYCVPQGSAVRSRVACLCVFLSPFMCRERAGGGGRGGARRDRSGRRAPGVRGRGAGGGVHRGFEPRPGGPFHVLSAGSIHAPPSSAGAPPPSQPPRPRSPAISPTL